MVGGGRERSRGGAYDRYKTTTRAFLDRLEKAVPFRLCSVADIAKAAEHVHRQNKENDIKLDYKALLDDLEETISLREKVGATYAEDYNDGHGFIIRILKYCRRELLASHKTVQGLRRDKRSNRVSKIPSASNSQPPTKNFLAEVSRNTFETHDSDSYSSSGSASDEEEMYDGGDFQLSEDPAIAGVKDYSIENDLIMGSLAFQANLFFLTVESLFSIVVNEYKEMEELMNSEPKPSTHQIVIQLMQTTASVNIVLENVSYLEKSFYLESDDLHTVYALFAVLVFQKEISQMDAILGHAVLEKNKRLCTYFVSHCIRCGLLGPHIFLSPSFDSAFETMFVDDIKIRCNESLSSAQLEQLKEISIHVCWTAHLESKVVLSKDHSFDNTAGCYVDLVDTDGSVWKELCLQSVHWLKNYGLLGGKMGIMHTFALHESGSFTLGPEEVTSEPTATGNMSFPEILNALWVKNLYRSLFVLRECGWIHRFREDIGETNYNKFIPFLPIFYSSCPELEKKGQGQGLCIIGDGTTFATVFGVHTLVYGIYILQNHIKRIEVISRLSMHKFTSQLDKISEAAFFQRLVTNLGRIPDKSVLGVLSILEKQPRKLAAFWNPLFAGNLISMMAFSNNLKSGLEPRAGGLLKRRVLLHLYNGLRQRKMIQEIDLLEVIDRSFSSRKEVWPTGKPQKEGFLKSFFLAIGDSCRLAERNVDFLKTKETGEAQNYGAPAPNREFRLRISHLSASKQSALERVHCFKLIRAKHKTVKNKTRVAGAAGLSSSFEAIFMPTYPDYKDSGQTSSLAQACSQKVTSLKEKIGQDHEVLSLNWVKVGHHVEECFDVILDGLGISSLVEEYVEVNELPRDKHGTDRFAHDVCNRFLADMVLREVEFEAEEGRCCNSKLVSSLMTEYFTNDSTLKASTIF